jgi:two-component system phosphate regulon sensor histidine kinase PhoR
LLVGAAALAVAAWAGRRAALSPLAAVRRQAERVADGELDARLPGTWSGALGAAAAALNRMTESLARRVRESEAQRARLEAVLAAMEEAVLAVDADERVLLANRGLRELFPAPGPLEGRPLLEAVRHAEVVDALRAALRDGEVQVREVAIGPGAERRVRFHVAPFAPPSGRPGAVVVFHDITELRRVESMRRDFVANASHELKTPLTAIRGFAERLAEADLQEPRAAQSVEVILANAKRLGALVEDLLELSRVEGGSAPVHLEIVDAADVARRLLRELEPRLRAGELMAEVEAKGEARVRADRRGLEQVLANLLDNAIKYTPPGGQIRVRAVDASADRMRIEVEDTGIGIPRKDLPRIFERFYRVDPGRSRALGGTGLGLAIVKHWIQAQGGQVGVESQPGRGSRFWIELPRSSA